MLFYDWTKCLWIYILHLKSFSKCTPGGKGNGYSWLPTQENGFKASYLSLPISLTVLGDNSFHGCSSKDNICPSLLFARNPSAPLKLWRHRKGSHQLDFRNYKTGVNPRLILSSPLCNFSFNLWGFCLFLKDFFLLLFYPNKAVFFFLLSRN